MFSSRLPGYIQKECKVGACGISTLSRISQSRDCRSNGAFSRQLCGHEGVNDGDPESFRASRTEGATPHCGVRSSSRSLQRGLEDSPMALWISLPLVYHAFFLTGNSGNSSLGDWLTLCTRSCFTSGTPDSSLHTTGNTQTHPSIGSRDQLLLEHHTQKHHCTALHRAERTATLTSSEATASSTLRKTRLGAENAIALNFYLVIF